MIITCDNCSTNFSKPLCHVKRNKFHFCKKDCFDEWKVKNFIQENNPNWKGGHWPSKASYVRLHRWVIRQLGKPTKCELCGTLNTKRYEWANRSRRYLQDLTDWISLCVSCHRKADANNLSL